MNTLVHSVYQLIALVKSFGFLATLTGQIPLMIYNSSRDRKYINLEERKRFKLALANQSLENRTFCLLLLYTGCRISEALELRPSQFDFSNRIVILRTLKKRDPNTYRSIPLPASLLNEIGIQLGAKPCTTSERLWPWCRSKAWGVVKSAMEVAAIQGEYACPKGLRHGFAVHALQNGVAITLVQKWMGHSRIETTAIYTQICGPEEVYFAKLMWDDE